jgi:hypothetical protein
MNAADLPSYVALAVTIAALVSVGWDLYTYEGGDDDQ